jgi:Histidine kinase-, DNA gyrase B-, and HSP90-like ATPase
MPAARGHEVIPSARRLINSLRDMGYDFAQAVADVVDNSIEASASLVAIDVEFDGDDSFVRIADNGKGMTADELREAMRYGAEREYDEDDLGKFGLGLKTASMSQCQRLSVASRWNRNRADIAAYAWDLDHIDRTNRWEILPLEANRIGPAIRKLLKDTTGTVVLWQRLDRILGYKHPYGENARKRLFQTCRDIEVHLGMVFQRFLTGKAHRKKLKLMLNGNEVVPWDAFCESEAKTRELQPVTLLLEHEGVSGEVLLQPYILPHQDDFSSPDAFRLASGPANWNQQQGFYIYRAGRMIQSGGWSHLRAPDEHTKLARIAVSFPPKLDDAFKINVAKMRVQMPAQIREAVREAIGPVIKLAREVYDRKAAKNSPAGTTPRGNAEIGGHHLTEKPAKSAARSDGWTFAQFARVLRGFANKRELPTIDEVLQRMRRGVTVP